MQPLREIAHAFRMRAAMLLRRRDLDRDLQDELAFHLEQKETALRSAGMPPDEARFAARRRFGNVDALTERSRDVWAIGALDRLTQDLRYAARGLRRNPLFTVVCVVTLALGIGANAAVLPLLHLRELPVSDPDRLVSLHFPAKARRSAIMGTSFPGCLDCEVPLRVADTLREGSTAWNGIAAFSTAQDVAIGHRDDVRNARALVVSENFFSVLGVGSSLGRVFTNGDGETRAGDVVVLSQPYWRERFAADPAVIGQALAVNGRALTVVGVADARFVGLDPVDPPQVFVPTNAVTGMVNTPGGFDMARLRDDAALMFMTIGRLRPGVTREQARFEVERRLRGALAAGPIGPIADDNLAAVVLKDAGRGIRDPRYEHQAVLRLLGGLASLGLLIAGANVASLLLARASARRREIAVRVAIGAGRLRIVRQLLTEGALLVGLGVLSGIVIGSWSARGLSRWLMPGLDEVALESGALQPAMWVPLAGIAGLFTLLFALAPAWLARQIDPGRELQSSIGPTPGTRSASWLASLGRAVIAVELAVAMTLLVAAGLFVRTVSNLLRLPGFATDHLIVAEVAPARPGETLTDANTQADAVRNRLGGLPGVSSVTWSSFALMGGAVAQVPIIDDACMTGRGCRLVASLNVGPSFFETVGLPLVAGHPPSSNDAADRPEVWVNRTLAVRILPGHDPIGAVVPVAGGEWRPTVMGVVADGRYATLRESIWPTAYQLTRHGARFFLLRTTVAPAALFEPVRHAIADVAPGLRVAKITEQQQLVEEQIRTERLLARIGVVLGALAALLAAIGVYGVLSYSVARRTGEIGIRMALGARREQVLRFVLRDGLRLIGAGAVIGALGAYAGSRFLKTFLFGVEPLDPLAFAAAAALLASVALVAAYVPAARASRVDPLTALRHE